MIGEPNVPSPLYGKIATLAEVTSRFVGCVAVYAIATALPSGDQSGWVAKCPLGNVTLPSLPIGAPVCASRSTSCPLSATSSIEPSGEYVDQPPAIACA